MANPSSSPWWAACGEPGQHRGGDGAGAERGGHRTDAVGQPEHGHAARDGRGDREEDEDAGRRERGDPERAAEPAAHGPDLRVPPPPPGPQRDAGPRGPDQLQRGVHRDGRRAAQPEGHDEADGGVPDVDPRSVRREEREDHGDQAQVLHGRRGGREREPVLGLLRGGTEVGQRVERHLRGHAAQQQHGEPRGAGPFDRVGDARGQRPRDQGRAQHRRHGESGADTEQEPGQPLEESPAVAGPPRRAGADHRGDDDQRQDRARHDLEEQVRDLVGGLEDVGEPRRAEDGADGDDAQQPGGAADHGPARHRDRATRRTGGGGTRGRGGARTRRGPGHDA